MENKERNKQILDLVCELMEMMNQTVDGVYVEDIESEGEEEQVLVSLTVANPANLIGFRGRNLAAIQLIVGLAVKNALGRWVKVVVDVNNYRNEQKERLENMAKNMAQKALATGTNVSLGPMSSFERRICHICLKEIEGISSESEGEGEERHIVIRPMASA